MRVVVFLLILFAAACHAQLSPKRLAELKALPAGEVLIAPGDLTVESFHGSDKGGIIAAVTGQDGAALRVSVADECKNRWDVGMGVPCPKAIAKDDVLLVSFWARSLAKGKGETAATQLVFRRATKPYKHCLSTTLGVTAEWRCYAMPFSPSYAMEADEGRFYMQFGMRKQRLEIRQVAVRNLGKSIPLGVLMRDLGVASSKSGSKVAGTPMTPVTLWEMGAHSGLPEPDPEFSPEGAWSHSYSIWTCHGYVQKGNKRIGFLEVTRSVAGEDDPLVVAQDIVNDEGLITRHVATIACAPDAVGTLRSWKLALEHIGQDGAAVADLGWVETAERVDGGFTVRSGQRVSQRRAPVRTAADWCLFDAVQRLPFKTGPVQEFAVLEGLTALKTRHRLTYRGVEEATIAGKTHRLHRFTQIGHGVLPYNYWLDEHHRLVMVVTHSRAYILSDGARKALEGYLKGQRGRYGNLAKRRGGK
ncbi:MAG: hypothetical protein HN742_00910 [Lentisphaerae bacterium]|nr:hypothetical protein [Lentisphaerota bacterium]MBT5606358.1 hypothetical protein [Lentisphaerota bacterium]MBT7056787.1 hypothetical protein [Lentisphaerota bacterium]MBT7840392.1 hypothetical protein [Lentisphaerota bacterium]